MQLPVVQFEEPLCFAVGVVSHAGCAEDWISKGNRDGGVIAAHFVANLGRLVLGLVQGEEASMRTAFKAFGPTCEALGPRQGVRVALVYLSHILQLIEGLVFQCRSPINEGPTSQIKCDSGRLRSPITNTVELRSSPTFGTNSLFCLLAA